MRQIRGRYGRLTLDDAFGVVVRPQGGEGYLEIVHGPPLPLPELPHEDDVRQELRRRLSLVFGIGPATEAAMRAADCPVTDIGALVGDQRYGPFAADVLRDLASRRLDALLSLVRARLGPSGHLLAARFVGLAAPERVAVLDFETLGLAGNVIFLAGVGRIEDGHLVVRQFLATTYDDEPAMLRRVAEELAGLDLLVTYNGRTADVPWLSSRVAYHRLGRLRIPPHLDLLHACRQRYVRELALLCDARLPTVQARILAMQPHETEIPGWMIPSIYKYYQRKPSRLEGMLVPVLEHNRQDVEAVGLLLGRLASEPVSEPSL